MVVSIDIGTSYSSISALGPDGKAHPVEIGTGASMFGSKFSLPSAVFVEENGEILVGQAAVNQKKLAPARFRMEFKRNLGEAVPIVLGNKSFLPEQLYTELIRHMKREAEKTGEDSIECAYMTFPASYGKAKKDKLIGAARAAGLFNVQLVEEPTAAAMSYCAAGYVHDGQTLLTYDFGGGTFDAALLRYEGGAFKLLTEPLGLPDCGGVDMDRVIFQDMISKVSPEIMTTLMKNPVNMMRFSSQLGELAVKAKHHLSFAEAFQEYIPVGFDVIPYELSREKFNGMIAALTGDTIDICRKMVEQAGMQISDLSSVLMVGGTSRVPLVREMVKQMAGSVPVYSAADLDLAVAQGALNYRMMDRNAIADQPEEPMQAPLTQQIHEEISQPEPEPTAEPSVQPIVTPESQTASEALHQDQLEELMNQADLWMAEPDENAQKAVAIYETAVRENYGPAQYMLGCICLDGTLIPKDPARGAELLQQAADNGIREAMPILADCYEKGIGVEQNLEYAISWYLSAVEAGSPEYETALGNCYMQRSGLPEDREEAAAWYYKAAERNDTAAMLALGRCYETGLGVPESAEQATAWYQTAADLGDPEAQYQLGLAYYQGSGVESSMGMAQYWLRKAMDDGHPDAEKMLIKLCGEEMENPTVPEMTEEQISHLRGEALREIINAEAWYAGLDPSGRRFNGNHYDQRRIFGVPYSEEVILALDSSMLRSGQSGFMMTDMGIYTKSRFSSARFYGWLAFLNFDIDTRSMNTDVRLTDGRVLVDCGGVDEVKVLQMMLTLQKQIAHLKEKRPELF